MASNFIKVKCKKCGNVQTVFSHATREVVCLGCGAVLLEPTGGKAHLVYGEIVEVVDEPKEKGAGAKERNEEASEENGTRGASSE